MQVAFKETMAGTFTAHDGGREAIIFTVTVEAPRARAFLTGAPMRLDGTITVGGLVRDAPTTGTLEVRLARLRDRELVYRLSFRDADGKAHSLMGRKTVGLLSALNDMTLLEGNLYRGTASLGDAELTFDLRHLPGFVRSFRVGG